MYGKAEFQPGMEEVDEIPIVPTTSPISPPIVPVPEADAIVAAESYGILQKGLFLAVILGCVAVYIRMTTRGNKRGGEKSMA